MPFNPCVQLAWAPLGADAQPFDAGTVASARRVLCVAWSIFAVAFGSGTYAWLGLTETVHVTEIREGPVDFHEPCVLDVSTVNRAIQLVGELQLPEPSIVRQTHMRLPSWADVSRIPNVTVARGITLVPVQHVCSASHRASRFHYNCSLYQDFDGCPYRLQLTFALPTSLPKGYDLLPTDFLEAARNSSGFVWDTMALYSLEHGWMVWTPTFAPVSQEVALQRPFWDTPQMERVPALVTADVLRECFFGSNKLMEVIFHFETADKAVLAQRVLHNLSEVLCTYKKQVESGPGLTGGVSIFLLVVGLIPLLSRLLVRPVKPPPPPPYEESDPEAPAVVGMREVRPPPAYGEGQQPKRAKAPKASKASMAPSAPPADADPLAPSAPPPHARRARRARSSTPRDRSRTPRVTPPDE